MPYPAVVGGWTTSVVKGKAHDIEEIDHASAGKALTTSSMSEKPEKMVQSLDHPKYLSDTSMEVDNGFRASALNALPRLSPFRHHVTERKRLKRLRRVKQFQGRLETLYSEAYAMVNSLGVDGMSSDDTDGEEYPVRAPVWRTPEVITVLDRLDGCRNETLSLVYSGT